MFYAVNHEMQSLHTIRAGSALEEKISKKSFENKLLILVKGVRHSVFKSTEAAKAFHAMLVLDGGQQ